MGVLCGAVLGSVCVCAVLCYVGPDVLVLSVLCPRPVTGAEVQLHRRGGSRPGGGPRSLPHRRGDHRHLHRAQGPPASLHRQSVSPRPFCPTAVLDPYTNLFMNVHL